MAFIGFYSTRSAVRSFVYNVVTGLFIAIRIIIVGELV